MPKKPARKPSHKPTWQKDTANERIARLFQQAEDSSKDHPERSRRYVEMAVKLSMRYNIRLSPSLKRRFCRACHSFLVPGRNATVRASPSQKAVIQTCGECGHVTRQPYRKERASRPKK